VECWIGVSQEPDRLLVRLAGRLDEAHVPDLLRACADAVGAVQIDLSDLLSADPVGLDALQRVRASGARLIGVPAYIELKLDEAASERPPGPRPVSPPRRKRGS
jgi:hypothetical protein